jgi:hypothetical protein
LRAKLVGQTKPAPAAPTKPANMQTLGNIKFDSNLARKGSYGNLIVQDVNSGKDYGVVRKKDGSYDWYKEGMQIPAQVTAETSAVAPMGLKQLAQPAQPQQTGSKINFDIPGITIKPKPEVPKPPVYEGKDFKEAFATARKELGPNKLFEYQGKRYPTNVAGEKFEPAPEVIAQTGLSPAAAKTEFNMQNKLIQSLYSGEKNVMLDGYRD